MATLTVPRSRESGRGPAAPQVPGGRRVRRPVRLAAGALLVLLCSLLGVAVLGRVDKRVPILVVARTVEPGEAITAADLGTLRVAGSGLATLPPSAEAAVVGRVAAGRLVPGTPVVMDELASAQQGDPNVVELPLALKAGQFPPELVRGDSVYVIGTAGAGVPAAGQYGFAPQLVAGRVVEIASQSSFGSVSSTTLTVSVPKSDAAMLAAASTTGAVVVAKAGG